MSESHEDISVDNDLSHLHPSGLVPLDSPYPVGPLSLGSPFYLTRSPGEEKIYREIKKPGALVRIKAPREMGKTSLLLRVLKEAKDLGYNSVSLNLEQFDNETLSNLDQFLRTLSANVARQLKLESRIRGYWDEDMGSKINCTLYFQDYLLESIDSPLILTIDEVNKIFEYPKVAQDFLPLLRSWYEEAKRLPIWQMLRLIVVHSTEIYVPLQLDQSPFNVGLPIELNCFTEEETKSLANRYGLKLNSPQKTKLTAMLGGHPALVQIALYHISRKEITPEQLLNDSSTTEKIYKNHLQRHWVILDTQPELANALENVMNATEPVELDHIFSHKLISLGLVKRSGAGVVASCELYRQAFKTRRQSPVRKRGVLLTQVGLEKLQKAKSEAEWQNNNGKKYTFEELNELTGLSIDTLRKVLTNEVPVDKQTIKSCFQAFNLSLKPIDFDYFKS